jgi:hypothetical protein
MIGLAWQRASFQWDKMGAVYPCEITPSRIRRWLSRAERSEARIETTTNLQIRNFMQRGGVSIHPAAGIAGLLSHRAGLK